ncbi:MAG: type II toxin-antitoxin system RelE/ParE family toxin [Caulobacteraceae bacterium]
MRSLALSATAVADLQAVSRYSRKTWGEAQRNGYMAALSAAIFSLRENPERGRIRPEIDAAVRSLRVQRHLVFYEYDDTELRILRVTHERMDLSKVL